ncbi:MAG: hypothetical protein K2X42_04970, partial [Burkholderiaceae bacterium]|nr:hypothetical protein [Burkholderiaceae bacterium]
MLLTTFRKFLAAAVLGLCVIGASAVPSLDAVKGEVALGHYVQAQTMMEEVLAAKPSSARAHYVYAEILAH